MQKLNLFEPFDGERGEAVIEASVDVEMDEDGDLNCDTDVERKILEELEVGMMGREGRLSQRCLWMWMWRWTRMGM